MGRKLTLSEKGKRKVKRTVAGTISRRKHKEKEAAPILRSWDRESREGCVVCGESMKECLDEHHPYGKKRDLHYTVILCASCHRVFDKNGGLTELKLRRKRYLDYNIHLRQTPVSTMKRHP